MTEPAIDPPEDPPEAEMELRLLIEEASDRLESAETAIDLGDFERAVGILRALGADLAATAWEDA